MTSKTILITGATGFIGSCIAHKLVNMNYDVHITKREQSNIWRIRNIINRIIPHDVDLIDSERVEKLIKESKPDIIIHTAIYGGRPYQKDIKKIIMTNFIGTVNLINACKKVGFELFVNTGSSSEYGIKSKPMTEDAILEPINEYGVSKAAGSLYCQVVARREKIPIVTLRIFSPYGYYDHKARLIPSVIMSCLAKKNPEIIYPNCVRDYIFVEDIVDAYIKVIETSNIIGEIFNIGYGKQHSMREVGEIIVKLTGSKVRLILGNAPKLQNEPDIWQADVSKAEHILKWRPKHSLEKGLVKTVKWFEKNMNIYAEQQKSDKLDDTSK